jgi:hypothetical protein
MALCSRRRTGLRLHTSGVTYRCDTIGREIPWPELPAHGHELALQSAYILLRSALERFVHVETSRPTVAEVKVLCEATVTPYRKV